MGARGTAWRGCTGLSGEKWRAVTTPLSPAPCGGSVRGGRRCRFRRAGGTDSNINASTAATQGGRLRTPRVTPERSFPKPMTFDPRHPPRPDPVPAKPVWTLHGATAQSVECCVRPTALRLYAVTVMRGAETFLSECYPDTPSAMKRATEIRDRLLSSGWSDSAKAVMS